jgi:shikimate dehydrogenase
MEITAKTRLFGVIGDPVEHSLSPAMHNAAFNSLGFDGVYLAFRVHPDGVGNAIAGVRALDIVGLNVTMPHKKAVISYLDKIDETTKFLNAVNTIHNKDGKLYGLNTDGIGAIKALKENGVNPKRKKVLLLGAGGAARALAYSLVQEADELALLNRNVDGAKELASVLKRKAKAKVAADRLTPSVIQERLKNADILINATSVGMKPNADESLVAPKWLRPDLAVMDIVYNPVETRLAKDAKSAGAKVVSGVEMLIYQGAASFQIWTGKPAPIEIMRKAAFNQLSKV